MAASYKVAIYCDSLSRGGAERVSLQLCQYFNDIRWKCDLITYRRLNNEYDCPTDIDRIILSENNASRRWGVINKLRKTLIQNRYDILVIMDMPASIYGILACIGLKIKVIVSERNDPTHFNGTAITRFLLKRTLKYAHGYVFQTNDAKKFWNRYIGNKGVIIHNPVDSYRLPNVYKGERKKVIVSVGRLTEQKNQKILIKAFKKISDKFNDYFLVIYGEGQLRSALEKQIKLLGLEKRVFLPGNVDDLLDRVKDAYMFVLPSNYEGMPNALIEAMCIGLPCISTDCPIGGPREIIKDCVNGLLVSVNNETELYKSMERLIIDRDLHSVLAKNSAYLRKELDLTIIGQKWQRYLTNIIIES